MKPIKLLLFIAVILLVSPNLFAISKVAARYNVFEFSVKNAVPQGSYGRIGIGSYGEFFDGGFGQPFDIDADDLYENTVSYGFNYGSLYGDNKMFNIGFSYTNVKHEETFEDVVYIYYYPNYIKLKLYEVSLNWHYYFTNPVKESFAPYAGIGLNAGLFNASVKGFDSENDFTYSLGLNFGADFTVWKSPDKMSSLALSSVNSYQFLASDSRPKYLMVGAGLKYFFRP